MCLPLLMCCCPPVHRVVVDQPFYNHGYVPTAVYHNVAPGYGLNVAAPLFGGRVVRQSPFVGGTTYRAPVITPQNNWQAPGLAGRVAPGPVRGFGAPRVPVGTRR